MIHIILLYGIKQPNNIVDHRYVNLFFLWKCRCCPLIYHFIKIIYIYTAKTKVLV